MTSTRRNNSRQKILKDNGHQGSRRIYDSDTHGRKLIERKDIDGVLIASTWDWHMPMAVESMQAKKYVGLEVPAAMTIEDCWKLVDTYEETGTNIMFLENCCYDRECMAVLQMIREGIFGIPMHATCGYRHSAWGNKKWLQPIDTTTKAEHLLICSAVRMPTITHTRHRTIAIGLI